MRKKKMLSFCRSHSGKKAASSDGSSSGQRPVSARRLLAIIRLVVQLWRLVRVKWGKCWDVPHQATPVIRLGTARPTLPGAIGGIGHAKPLRHLMLIQLPPLPLLPQGIPEGAVRLWRPPGALLWRPVRIVPHADRPATGQAVCRCLTAAHLLLPRRRTTAGHPAHRQVGALIHIMERAIHLRCLRPLGTGRVQRLAIRREARTGVVADGLPVGAVNTGTFHLYPPMRHP